tara:strand:- start:8432 stop:8863 length:432 start_codon:yes stop_codon:yes gene_type:complete
MAEDFVQLMYLSNSKPELKQSDLDAILEVSRRNNPSRGITGLLVFANGVFIQVLEGPTTEVHNLFETICDDSRHEAVAIIAEYLDQERLFSKWSMAFIQSTFDELTKITDTPKMLNRDDVLELLSNDKTKAARFLKDFATYVD